MLLTLVRISVWRANPQDLPASYALFGLALTAHVIADLVGLSKLLPLGKAIIAAVFDTGMLAGLTAALLAWRNLNVRFVQTVTALAGATVVLSVTVFVVEMLSGKAVPAELLGLAILAWYLAIHTHVLRHALSVSGGQAFAISLLYMLVSAMVNWMFIGIPAPQEV